MFVVLGVTTGDRAGGQPADLTGRLHAAAVGWLLDRLDDPGWRARPDAGREALAAVELVRALAGSGHGPLPDVGAWWSSADVTRNTSLPPRTVRRRMADPTRWPSARRTAGRWFVHPADVLADLASDDGPITSPPTSTAAGAALAACMPAPLDGPHRALLAVLERTASTPSERAEVADAWQLERARAALYRARAARRRPRLRLTTTKETTS